MRILFITPYFYPHQGGSQNYSEELYSRLMKNNPKIKVDVLCYNTDRQPEKEQYRGFTVYRIPCLQILPGQFAVPNYIKLYALFKKLNKKNKYAFINSNSRFFESSWWIPFAAKAVGTKSMLTDHCASHPVHPSRLVSTVAKLVDKLLVPIIANQYDSITVTNKATYNFLKSLRIKKPTIIYGGVDTSLFKSYKKDGTRKLPKIERTFSKNDIVISFVGRMIYSKGPQLLLSSAKNITKDNKNVYFIFAGGGKMNENLKKNHNNQIFFVGPLEKRETADLMRKSDILVHPSMHHEGFPNVLLEAGASGCAVIATDRGGTREIILNNKTGLLIEPKEEAIEKAIVTLLNEDERKRLSLALKKHVQAHFDWKIVVREFEKLIGDLIPDYSA